jgi:hypothetical protein
VNQLFGQIPNEAILLLLFLKANNKPTSTFLISNGMAPLIGMSRRELQSARRALLGGRFIRCVRQAAQNSPALYRWNKI